MNKEYNRIFVNGQAFNCHTHMSLKELLTYLEFELKSIIVEYNYVIIHDSAFDTTFLQSGDKIEIITIVGGG
uniref:Thiamine biosynthesis protein n=1 Tax=Gracilaria urvillei TaxID=172974 RepID=UPI001D0F92EF|nr:Thiamine biosynthesis protein [Hydropuntia urvillei]UAD88519.1 Thiamine biosynthesis protein [Hydropuntia urvillei]